MRASASSNVELVLAVVLASGGEYHFLDVIFSLDAGTPQVCKSISLIGHSWSIRHTPFNESVFTQWREDMFSKITDILSSNGMEQLRCAHFFLQSQQSFLLIWGQVWQILPGGLRFV